MSFSARTPESLLPRSDSKNPATTCRGITTAGRPCRRALAASPQTSPAPSPTRGTGVLAVLHEEHAAAFFCYQHKDQAEQLVAKNRQRTSLHPLKERSSIDTLAERVGILYIDEDVARPTPTKTRPHANRAEGHATKRRDTLPAGWNQMQSPLMSVPDDLIEHRPRPVGTSHRPRSNVKFAWSCCLQSDSDDDDPRPSRASNNSRQPRHRQTSRAGHSGNTGYAQVDRRRDDRVHMQPPGVRPEMVYSPNQPQPRTKVIQSSSSRPIRPRPEPNSSATSSQTQNLLSLIPATLSPQTTSLLLTELSRPISEADEAGYIYIFWLTPESDTTKPDDEVASSLLDDSDDDDDEMCAANDYGGLYPTLKSSRAQKTTQTLQRYASVRQPSNTLLGSSPRSKVDQQRHGSVQRTILLKIGRAANVHRRMSQWTKQCGQDITLIRYYPHTPSNPKAHKLSTSNHMIAGRKVPHVHRVERLIHLELADKRVVKPECQACGREHREWFEIDASRNGLTAVDGVIKRWTAWAETAMVQQHQPKT